MFASNTTEFFSEGTEITEENVTKLFNGMEVKISLKGEDYIFKDGRSSGATLTKQLDNAGSLNLPKPPQGWNEIKDHDQDQNIKTIQEEEEEIIEQNEETIFQIGESSIPIEDIECEDQFPILNGNVLSSIRECIKDSNVFYQKHGDGYYAFDYKSSFHVPPNTFLDPKECSKKSKERIIRSIRRECRGLILSDKTGKVIGRRFHKFFNLNEKEETKIGNKTINPNEFILMEKLDGSLVTPIQLDNKNLVWMTKTTIIDEVESFVKINRNNNIKYEDFSLFWINNQYTPLFEWCDSSRVVGQISHEKSSLVLLGIRHMITGKYLSRKETEDSSKIYSIPLVDIFHINDLGISSNECCLNDIIQYLNDQYNREGFVAWFTDDDTMVKLKTLWYVSLSSASKISGQKNKYLLTEILKQRPNLIGISDQIIWSSCLSKSSDDIISSATSLLQNNSDENSKQQANYLHEFYENVQNSIENLIELWNKWGNDIHEIINNKHEKQRKEIQQSAIVYGSSFGWLPKIPSVFIKQNKNQGIIEIQQFINGLLSKKQYQGIEKILNLSWNLNQNPNSIIHTIHIGEFDIASDNIRNFVLDKYFPRKIAKYLGILWNDIHDDIEIQIPSNYSGEEGKIKGMWEQFEKEGIIDLRVDIQPPHPSGFNHHFGDKDYCHWQIQYGPSKVSKKSSKFKPGCEKSGAFAGILIQTNKTFTIKQFKDALSESFNSHQCVILGDLPLSNDERLKISTTQDNNNIKDEKIEISKTSKIERKIIIENHEEIQVYCDLDGVLADFELGVKELTGKSTDEMSIDYMWKRIITSGKFFIDLQPYDYTNEFWKKLKQYGNGKPIILTGLPNSKFAKKVKKQKQQWCKKYLDADVEVITCMSKDKHQYSNHLSILIDDRISQRKNWEENKGFFIHHTNDEKTFFLLDKLFKNDSWNDLAKKDGQSLLDHYQQGNNNDDGYEEFKIQKVIQIIGHKNVDLLMNSISSANIVAFDCEWRPDELIDFNKYKKSSKSSISIIQLSFNEEISFIIDMMQVLPSVVQSIQNLFSNPSILKIGYGIDEDLKIQLFSRQKNFFPYKIY